MPEFTHIPTSETGIERPARPARRGATRTEELRDLIADEIVCGRLAPGMALEEAEIARRFGVSRTPVREVIRELAATGLIEARAHRSAIVARPSAERLRGMFDVLAELEALCAGLSAIQMTADERRHLQELHESLGDLVRRGDPQRYHHMNVQFHGLVYVGSHNAYLAELTAATRTRLSPSAICSSAPSAGSACRITSMSAWSRQFCAAIAPSLRPRCGPISPRSKPPMSAMWRAPENFPPSGTAGPAAV